MAWFELLNQAVRFYNEGNDSECIALLTNIMRSLLPPYAKIRCHTLMAYALDDWYEAELMRFKAENCWKNWRAYWRPGDSARVDRLLQETRTSLDELAEEMRRSRPDDWIDHQLVWTDIDAQNRDAEITEALEEYAAEYSEAEQVETAEQAGAEQEEVIQRTEGEA